MWSDLGKNIKYTSRISGLLAIAPSLRFDGRVIWQTMIRKRPMRSASMTKFRHLIWMATAAVGLTLSISQSYAQQPDVGDQPGLLADDSVELEPEYRKQMVFYRSTEPPGTIIISTAERHLYLIHGNGRAIRYGIGVGRDGAHVRGGRVGRGGGGAGRGDYRRQGGRADLAPAGEKARGPPLSAALRGGRTGKPARPARDVPRQTRLPHPRPQPPGYVRHRRII